MLSFFILFSENSNKKYFKFLLFSKYILLHPHSTQCPTHLLGWLQQAEQERGRHLMACSLYPITLVSPSLSDPLQPLTPSTSHITWSPHFIPAQIFAGTWSLRPTLSTPSVPSGGRSGTVVQLATVVVVRVPSSLPPTGTTSRPPALPSYYFRSTVFGQFWSRFFTRPFCLGLLWTAMISLSVYNICSSRKWPTVSSTSDPSYYYCSTLFGKFWTRFYTVQLWPAV